MKQIAFFALLLFSASCARDFKFNEEIGSVDNSAQALAMIASTATIKPIRTYTNQWGTTGFLNIVCGNFDASGVESLAVLRKEANHVSILRNKGDGFGSSGLEVYKQFNIAEAGGNDFRGIAAGDIDGDGKDEVIILRSTIASSTLSHILVYKIPEYYSVGSPALLMEKNVGGALYDFKGITVADFNRDGKDDIAIAKTNVSQIIFYSYDGNSLLTKGTINFPNTTVNWTGIAAGNIDSDPAIEFIAVRKGDASNKDLLFYKISTSWAISSAGAVNYNGLNYDWKGVAIGEFDHDVANGKEFALFKNTPAGINYFRYKDASTIEILQGQSQEFTAPANMLKSIATGRIVLNTGGDQLVGVSNANIVFYGDEIKSFTEKKGRLSFNGFSFGTYWQSIPEDPNYFHNSDGTLKKEQLSQFCKDNKISVLNYLIANVFSGQERDSGIEYVQFIDFLEYIKTNNPGLKVVATLCGPTLYENAWIRLKPVPGDSPHILGNETNYFTGMQAKDSFVAWFKLLGIVGKKYTNLVGINIDDFSHNISTSKDRTMAFNRQRLGRMIDSLRKYNNDIAFIPTIYYSSIDPSLDRSWARDYTDGFTYYFRNEHSKDPLKITPPDLSNSGTLYNMHGAVTLPSDPSTGIGGGHNYINTEINAFKNWQTNPYRLFIIGIYATTHERSTTKVTAFTTDKLMRIIGSNRNFHGVMLYTTQNPNSEIGKKVYQNFTNWWSGL